MKHLNTAIGTAIALSLTAIVTDAAGQPVPLDQANVAVLIDTGLLANNTAEVGSIFRTVVEVPHATWIRLTFEEALLADGTVLRMTSLADGAMQHHTATTLEQWNNTSAYFNGDAVRVELIARPGGAQSRILITNVLIGLPPDGGIESQCGPLDDRLTHRDGTEWLMRAIDAGAVLDTIADVLVLRRLHEQNLSRRGASADRREILMLAQAAVARRRDPNPTAY